MHQHGEHPHLKLLAKIMMKRNQNQKKTHKILMLLIMQQNLSGRVNPKGKLKGAQLEHLHS